MIKPIIDNIITDLTAGLWFVDKIGGLVERKRLNIAGVEKVLPVKYNEDPQTCTADPLIHFVPDEQYKTIIYFEQTTDSRVINMHRNWYEMDAGVRLVCWINWNRINITPDPERIAANIIKEIPIRYQNTEYLNAIRIEWTGKMTKGADIFSQYTYDEKERQFLTYPYDAIALDYRFVYRVAPSCADLIAEEPKPCL